MKRILLAAAAFVASAAGPPAAPHAGLIVGDWRITTPAGTGTATFARDGRCDVRIGAADAAGLWEVRGDVLTVTEWDRNGSGAYPGRYRVKLDPPTPGKRGLAGTIVGGGPWKLGAK